MDRSEIAQVEPKPDPVQDGFPTSESLNAKEFMSNWEHSLGLLSQQWTGADAETIAAAEQRFEMRRKQFRRRRPLIPSRHIRSEVMRNGERFYMLVWIGKYPSSDTVIQDHRVLVLKQEIKDGLDLSRPLRTWLG